MKPLALIGSLILLASWTVQAKVSHVSINLRAFELGEHPSMRVNLVTDKRDLSRLAFVLSQQGQEEKLMAVSLNKFMLLLTGVDNVFDSDAELVVSEYRIDRWHEIERLPVFADGIDVAPSKAKIRAIQERLAKTGKSSKAKQAYHNKLQRQVVNKSVAKPSHEPKAKAASIAEKTAVAEETISTQVEASPKLVMRKSDCYLAYSKTETLWRIATRYGQEWQVNPYSAIMAIYDANPKAFNKGKISSLRADVKLACPTDAAIEANKSSKQAKQRFDTLL